MVKERTVNGFNDILLIRKKPGRAQGKPLGGDNNPKKYQLALVKNYTLVVLIVH